MIVIVPALILIVPVGRIQGNMVITLKLHPILEQMLNILYSIVLLFIAFILALVNCGSSHATVEPI